MIFDIISSIEDEGIKGSFYKMTNEEFQKLILEKLVSIEKGQRNLEKVQLEVSDRVIVLEGNINAIHEQTITLSEFREETEENFSILSNKVDGIENKLNDIESINANRHLDLELVSIR